MTNEEAIKIFKSELDWAEQNRYPYISENKVKAIKLAIKALEQTDKIEESNFSTEQYKADLQAAYDCGYAKALEQQPSGDVLDKIRAEIEKKRARAKQMSSVLQMNAYTDCLQIIDKYKAESEE